MDFQRNSFIEEKGENREEIRKELIIYLRLGTLTLRGDHCADR